MWGRRHHKMLRRFVVWIFDFLLIICHLRAQLCLELLAIFKISSFYFMVYAKPYGLLVIKVGQCQQPERREVDYTWVHILFIVRRNFLVWLNAHTYMEFLYIAWEYVGCFGRKLDTLICIIYISTTPSAILNFCRYCKLLRHCVCKFSHFTCRQWSESVSLSEFSLFPQQLWDWHGPHLRWRLGADCFLRICSFYKYNKTYDKL